MKQKGLLFSAAVAGLVFSAGAMAAGKKGASHKKADAKPAVVAATGECSGINTCKGKGECGGAGHECAGHNECKGKGWVKATEADCKAKQGTFKASKT